MVLVMTLLINTHKTISNTIFIVSSGIWFYTNAWTLSRVGRNDKENLEAPKVHHR